MKDEFFEYNMGRNGTIDKVKANGIIVLDTNALLSIYRFSSENRKKYIEILNSTKDRLFLTNQSVQEFYNNRIQIIYNKANFKSKLKDELTKQIDDLSNIIENSNFKSANKNSCNLIKHEKPLKDDIINILGNCKKKIQEKIDSYNVDIERSFINDNDPIIDEILEIFEEKVNSKFTDEDLEKIYKSGKERYLALIPPGYEDNKTKTEPACYGDLVIWKEMIEIAKSKQRDILFVSDDRKPDWCENFKGYDLGPRKELLKEFFSETNQLFYSITTNEFIRYISGLHTIIDTTDLERESEIIGRELLDTNTDKLNRINNGIRRLQHYHEKSISASEFAKILEDAASRGKSIDEINNELLISNKPERMSNENRIDDFINTLIGKRFSDEELLNRLKLRLRKDDVEVRENITNNYSDEELLNRLKLRLKKDDVEVRDNITNNYSDEEFLK